jgi:uncharacterized surface protein with fasciclin (FAS1) repeats
MSISKWKFNTTANDTFFWQALSESGEILGRSSQDFKSQNGAKYNADLVGRNGEISKQLIWEFTQDSQHDWTWKAHNSVNKENVATSHKSFDTKSDAANNATLFGYKGEALVSEHKSYTNTANSVSAFAASENPVEHTTTITSGSHSYSEPEPTHTNYNFTGRTSKIADDTKVAEFRWIPWIKWLLVVLLLIAILWWLLPWLLNLFKVSNNGTTTTNTSITSPKTTGLLAALPGSNYSLLSSNIQSAGLLDTINNAGPLTLFAPVNSAFESIPADTLANLKKPENLSKYQNLLKNHLVAGNMDLNSLKDGSTVKSLAGYDLPVKIDSGKLYIDGVEIDKTIDGNTNNINVYSVPNILEIPTSILPTANNSTPASTTTTPVATGTPKSLVYNAGGSLDTANKAGNFKTLLAAINAADLASTLDGTGPFTIFAPTDEVFATIQPTVTDLLKPENKSKLQAFLKNHVVSGKFTFVDFQSNKTLTSLGGQSITLNTSGPGSTGQVVGPKSTSLAPVADINTSNGVIHTLTDKVIL